MVGHFILYSETQFMSLLCTKVEKMVRHKRADGPHSNVVSPVYTKISTILVARSYQVPSITWHRASTPSHDPAFFFQKDNWSTEKRVHMDKYDKKI